MFNKIDEVQRQYTFAVQPVKFFETENSKNAQKSSFDFINQMNKSGYNPFHPSVEYSNKGQKLDLLG